MLSVVDLFKIGVGPSSSHTVGPMIASKRFIHELMSRQLKVESLRIKVTLLGSLGATGRGHASDRAVILGLMGLEPSTIDPDRIDHHCIQVAQEKRILLECGQSLRFDPETDLMFDPSLQHLTHPNTIRFQAFDIHGIIVHCSTFLSVGGGFVQKEGEEGGAYERETPPQSFTSADALLALCREHQCSIHELVKRNELFWHSSHELTAAIDHIWRTMKQCVERGLHRTGVLPGVLQLPRRSSQLRKRLEGSDHNFTGVEHFYAAIDWVNAWALAVNEENASGSQVVTAPTNGAAGIVPAVLMFAQRSMPDFNAEAVEKFLLTATAFGYLFKRNASISGADVGCQGEVGSACAMAAAGLASLMGGSPAQIENAAEIATEHNLGLTCDPVAGLVQVPCIERNAIAAVKAINAARMAMLGTGEHFVSFDKVVLTVRDTGADMASKYKETSTGGLAVNVIEC